VRGCKIFISRRGRTVTVGQKVKVYRNLNKPDFFSICDKKSNLVLGYSKSVTLESATYIVRESSRQRVLKEKRRNVHAWVEGSLVNSGTFPPEGVRPGYYNPYHTSLFIDHETKAPIMDSDIAHCEGKYVYFK